MVASAELEKKHLEELNESIASAMKKVGVQKELDLRSYVPGVNGKLHHISFLKLKNSAPKDLQQLIQKHILDKENPEPLFPSSRASLKTKRTVDLKIRKSMVNQILNALKDSKIDGIEEVIKMLSPHQTIGQIQKLMLDMVRAREVDMNLWETYVRLVKESRATTP